MTRQPSHLRTNAHLLNYHLVWCPKRRRKVLVGDIREALLKGLHPIADEHRWSILALEVMPDHVHCFVAAPPRYSVSEIVRRLKGQSSRMLRQRFRALRRMPVLWSPSYFAGSAGNVSSATIERYIAEQTTR